MLSYYYNRIVKGYTYVEIDKLLCRTDIIWPRPILKQIFLMLIQYNTRMLPIIRLVCKWTSVDPRFKRMMHHYSACYQISRLLFLNKRDLFEFDTSSWYVGKKMYATPVLRKDNSQVHIMVCDVFVEPYYSKITHVSNTLITINSQMNICFYKKCMCDNYHLKHLPKTNGFHRSKYILNIY